MKTSSLRIVDLVTTAIDKKFEPVAHMADAIVEQTLQRGDCLPQDLYGKGFSPGDIVALWHMADSMAAIELKHLSEATIF